MKKFCTVFVLQIVVALTTVFAFEPADEDSSSSSPPVQQRKIVEAVRTTTPLMVDGLLNEEIWQRPGITGFTQKDPNEGMEATQKTEVWVAYDDAALYVAARMYDTSPDSIVSRIGRRDADINADWFYVGIDSYHDRRSGFFFGVYPSGAINDGTLYNDEWDDDSWDGIWDAATSIDSKGWVAELRIPYSQLRFPEQEQYIWGINFARGIDRNKEQDDFVMVPKKESGWVSKFADLVGIRDIHPPSRIEVLPYVVSSSLLTNQYQPGDPFKDNVNFSGNMGADIKLGLGSNLTLNATFNPDFGQVEVDPAVVNLSQFETFFDEKRPFFIEGSNMFNFGYGGSNNNWGFNFGNPDYFYSRRIGRHPQGSTQHSGFTNVPDGTTILAAAKLTGKIADGWSLGTLHAFTEREYAKIDDGLGNRFSDVVEPFTSYNVIRSQREFNQGKQAIGFIGTAAIRDLNENYLVDQFNRRAYSFGIDGWTNLDTEQEYVLTGWVSATRVEGSANRILTLQQAPLHYYQRPDASHVEVDPTATSLAGYGGRIAINKQKGNTYLNWALGIISPGFDSNDMGFLFRTDVVNSHLVLGYNWYEPDGIFRRKNINVATFRNYTLGGQKNGEGYFIFSNWTFMNYWSSHIEFWHNPATLDTRNTRGGPMMKTTNAYGAFFNLNTDGRQTVVFGAGVSTGRSESGGYRVTTFPYVEFKPSAGVNISFSPEFNRDITIAQWVMRQDDPTATSTYGARYVFAKIDQRELSASIRLDWTFTPKLSLQLYMQPLISVGAYSDFKELRQPETYSFNRYGIDNNSTINTVGESYQVDPDGTGAHNFIIENPDFNFKSLRGNAVLRWEYLPGSTMYFVWTQNRTNFDNPGTFDLGRDLGNTFGASDHENAFLVKVAYWWHP